LSSYEAEYVVAASTVCKVMWLRNILKDLDHPQEKSTMIFVDNKLAIQLAKNPIHHGRSKHMDTRFYFLRDYVSRRPKCCSIVILKTKLQTYSVSL